MRTIVYPVIEQNDITRHGMPQAVRLSAIMYPCAETASCRPFCEVEASSRMSTESSPMSSCSFFMNTFSSFSIAARHASRPFIRPEFALTGAG